MSPPLLNDSVTAAGDCCEDGEVDNSRRVADGTTPRFRKLRAFNREVVHMKQAKADMVESDAAPATRARAMRCCDGLIGPLQ